MLDKLVENEKYCEKMHDNCSEIVNFLLDNGIEFGVICGTEQVVFEPPLPNEIKKNIKPIALFVLSNYSFESAYYNNDTATLFFEAGFGPDNYASLVGIDIDDIIQIVVEETPIFINVCSGRQKKPQAKKESKAEASSADRSMQKLLSRPENKKFLK